MRGHIAHVALDQGLDVVPIPDGPTWWSRTRQRRRVSAGDDPRRKLPAEAPVAASLEVPREEGIEASRPGMRQFALCLRMEPQQLHPTGQRIRKLGNEQHVR